MSRKPFYELGRKRKRQVLEQRVIEVHEHLEQASGSSENIVGQSNEVEQHIIINQDFSHGNVPFPDNHMETDSNIHHDVENHESSNVTHVDEEQQLEQVENNVINEDNRNIFVSPDEENDNHTDNEVEHYSESEDDEHTDNEVNHHFQLEDEEPIWPIFDIDDSSESEGSDQEEPNTGEDSNPNTTRAQDHHFRGRQPIYRGAPITVGESMLLILTILLHHNIIYSCLADIITVINFHCLKDGLKKNSLFKFKKYFSLSEAEVKKHYYCSNCFRTLDSFDTHCPSCPRRKIAYFVELPIVEQLQEMYERHDFYDNLKWRSRRPSPSPGHLGDIYDGSLYKEHVANGFLKDSNISLSWYTDGVQVFKYSKISVWPIYQSINELPFEIRKNKENTILAGLWFGDCKPHANSFLYPLKETFDKLYIDGINVYIPSQDDPIRVKAILLTGICDLPAKQQFQNLTQYNGAFGCPECFLEGLSMATDGGGSTWVFPYADTFPLRTKDLCVLIGDRATLENPIYGIKRPTVLSQIMPDFIKGIGIDKMHAVDSGVVKKILTLLFDVKYRTKGFSMYSVINLINEKLTAIKPPKFVHRMPRTVNDILHWKASELRLWFFYYSLPIFHGILRQDLFDNYLSLLLGIFYLNSDSVSIDGINTAQLLLHRFVKHFQTLYGLEYCSINIHQLLHLFYCFQRLGPLWTFSGYEYENLNGLFIKLVHGTWHIDTQIAQSHSQHIKMQRYIDKLNEGPLMNFCKNGKYQVKILEKISPKCYSVGNYLQLSEVPLLLNNVLAIAGIRNYRSLFEYFRLLKDGKLSISTEYPREMQTESHFIKYTENNVLEFGSIQYFVKIVENCNCLSNDCECNVIHIAIVQKIEPHEMFVLEDHNVQYTTRDFLISGNLSENIKAVNINNIVNVCIKMMINDILYIGIPVNNKELE